MLTSKFDTKTKHIYIMCLSEVLQLTLHLNPTQVIMIEERFRYWTAKGGRARRRSCDGDFLSNCSFLETFSLKYRLRTSRWKSKGTSIPKNKSASQGDCCREFTNVNIYDTLDFNGGKRTSLTSFKQIVSTWSVYFLVPHRTPMSSQFSWDQPPVSSPGTVRRKLVRTSVCH